MTETAELAIEERLVRVTAGPVTPQSVAPKTTPPPATTAPAATPTPTPTATPKANPSP